MSAILMLTNRMSMGFGVSVVVDQLSQRLRQHQIPVFIGCMEQDRHFAHNPWIHPLPAEAKKIQHFAHTHGIRHIIAHTSPYFEQLPLLSGSFVRWAWEHGDPTPALFPDEQARQAIIDHKRLHVYPQIERVIAISEFVRQDIRWPQAVVITNGADHLPALTPRKNLDRPLRIGTIMRLGKGERFYKGGALFIRLAQALQHTTSMQFAILGRGEACHAREYRHAGIEVHLNASDQERTHYLEHLDVFVSLSLWEGFNLPLVEAQMAGKLALALDTGAHPEVTPFIFTHLQEIEALLHTLDANRNLLYEYARKSQAYCQKQLRWARSLEILLRQLKSTTP